MLSRSKNLKIIQGQFKFRDLFSITGEQTCIPVISTKCDLYYHLVQSDKKKKENEEKKRSFISSNRVLDFTECYAMLQLCNDSPVL